MSIITDRFMPAKSRFAVTNTGSRFTESGAFGRYGPSGLLVNTKQLNFTEISLLRFSYVLLTT